MLNSKKILVTGGTGSFSQAFTRLTLEKYNQKNIKLGLVYGTYWFRDENRDSVSVGSVGDMPSGRALPALLKRNYVGILTMVVRRPILQGLNGPFNDRYEVIGDTDFVLRVAGGWEIKAVEHPVATYRWHDSNDTKRKAERHSEEWVDWLADISLVPWIFEPPGFESRRIMIYEEIARCIVQNKTCKLLKKLYLASQSWSEKLSRLLRVFLYVSVYLLGKGWPRSC